MPSDRIKLATAVVALALSAGCGEEKELIETVPLDKLPPGVLKTAEKTLPDVKFDLARKIKLEGKPAYEVRGKNKEGKIREVEVDEAGKVIEVE